MHELLLFMMMKVAVMQFLWNVLFVTTIVVITITIEAMRFYNVVMMLLLLSVNLFVCWVEFVFTMYGANLEHECVFFTCLL